MMTDEELIDFSLRRDRLFQLLSNLQDQTDALSCEVIAMNKVLDVNVDRLEELLKDDQFSK